MQVWDLIEPYFEGKDTEAGAHNHLVTGVTESLEIPVRDCLVLVMWDP